MQRYRPKIRRPKPTPFTELEPPAKGQDGYNRRMEREHGRVKLARDPNPNSRAGRRRAGRERRLREIALGHI